jgi:ribosomal protein S18 acetylase RimI-like enzyme
MEQAHDPEFINQITFRQAERQDLPDLEWEGELLHYRRLFAEIYRQKELGSGLMWVAELEGEGIIGQLFVHLNSPRVELADGISRAYVYGFRVKANYQGRGLGTLMMEIAERDLLKRGFTVVSLNVGQDNEGALRLYKKLGYRVTGPDPGRWSYVDHTGKVVEVNEPAWRMQKKLKSEEKK